MRLNLTASDRPTEAKVLILAGPSHPNVDMARRFTARLLLGVDYNHREPITKATTTPAPEPGHPVLCRLDELEDVNAMLALRDAGHDVIATMTTASVGATLDQLEAWRPHSADDPEDVIGRLLDMTAAIVTTDRV